MLCNISDPYSLFNANTGDRINSQYMRRVKLLANGEGLYVCIITIININISQNSQQMCVTMETEHIHSFQMRYRI